MSSTTLTPEDLEAMLDRAARRGAAEALATLGLHDATALLTFIAGAVYMQLGSK